MNSNFIRAFIPGTITGYKDMGVYLTNENVKIPGCGHLVKAVSLMLSPADFNAVASLLDDLFLLNPFMMPSWKQRPRDAQ